MDPNVNEPSKLMCWRDDRSLTSTFVKQSKNDASKETYNRDSLPRKALGDKKNIPTEEAKNNKAEVKTQTMEKSSSRRKDSFDVFCESTSAECVLVDGMGSIRKNSETAEEQFERVDPDAPVEHFNYSSSSEGYEGFWTSPSRTLHADEVLHSAYTIMGAQRPAQMHLLEEEILEDDIFETPFSSK